MAGAQSPPFLPGDSLLFAIGAIGARMRVKRARCPPKKRNMDQNDTPLTPRPVKDSISDMIEIVLPNDTNPLGALLGGRLMHWIDLAGALAAHRHARSYVVTASIDHLDFLVPVHVGDLVVFLCGPSGADISGAALPIDGGWSAA